ncbi:NAD-dependent epimerase/dehydratase family protein [Gordonia amarae NBRC 15530]|uniref:NAD-dependent epimerase/dehydratase family protein n=1 Tax=Gordonia amarae NBRC 15530 TaxID=1075090 RepID=G7GLM1_9ACTN|nr:NAD-dependent epimerase/dehydratase family protein [Gordonia amarae NBRC 15530]
MIGASGFLGGHVVRLLADDGHDVRALLRPSSSTRSVDGLPVEVVHGDIFDDESIRRAMTGCDEVYYCVVDARPWLRDPAPLWRTNVDGLRQVLDVAITFPQVGKFVFTSSMATIGIAESGLATEVVHHNWSDKGGEYVAARVAAENLVLDYHREHGLPAVAMCVANTYGPGDWLPTPHGRLLSDTLTGAMPFYIRGVASEVVGVRDAARALILAGERGRPGERYIVAERFLSAREINDIACTAIGRRPPALGVPRQVMSAAGAVGEVFARLRRRDNGRLTRQTARLMHVIPRLDHGKAVRELGWQPTPAPEVLREAAIWFDEQARLRREAKRRAE